VIHVRDIVKYHGPHRVLDGATLTAAAGQLTALVGPSGGGKSTLLRCVNGLEPFHTGRVEVFGHVLPGTDGRPHSQAQLVGVRRVVGMVFQQFNLFPHMTVVQNVMCGPRYALGLPEPECRERATRQLARVGLTEKADAKPAALSGGQQQRVAIARTLAVGPKAVLFDEPTSALDPELVGEVLAVMRDLAADGQTILIVTHDMDLARRADIVHQMRAGKVANSGPPAEVFS
jgi:ABC-type polar amino acid transport system ATPase subunit